MIQPVTHRLPSGVRLPAMLAEGPLWRTANLAAVLALVTLAALVTQPVFWFTGFSMLLAWLGLLRHRILVEQERGEQ